MSWNDVANSCPVTFIVEEPAFAATIEQHGPDSATDSADAGLSGPATAAGGAIAKYKTTHAIHGERAPTASGSNPTSPNVEEQYAYF